MTNLEAIRLMEQGKKVTHRYFSANEFITIKDGKIVTEEGYSCTPKLFWSHRLGGGWNDGWEEFKEQSSTNSINPVAIGDQLGGNDPAWPFLRKRLDEKNIQLENSADYLAVLQAMNDYRASPLPADIVSQLRKACPHGAKPTPHPEEGVYNVIWNEACDTLQSLLTSPSQPGSLEGEDQGEWVTVKKLERMEDKIELLGKCLNMLRYLYMNEYCGDHAEEVRGLIVNKPRQK